MKKLLMGLAILAALAGVASAQKVNVRIDQRVVLFDVPPMDRNGVTMVPIRNMVDAMDATMQWNLERQTVTVWKNSRKFEVVLNNRQAWVDGKTIALEEAPFIHKGRIFVPLRFMAEAAGYVISLEEGWYVFRPTRR